MVPCFWSPVKHFDFLITNTLPLVWHIRYHYWSSTGTLLTSSYSDFLSFYFRSSLYSRLPGDWHISLHLLSYPWSLLGCDSFSDFHYFFYDLANFRGTSEILCKIIFHGNSMLFLKLTQAIGLEEDHGKYYFQGIIISGVNQGVFF